MSQEKNTDSRSSSPAPSTSTGKSEKTAISLKATNTAAVERITQWPSQSELILSDDDSDDKEALSKTPSALSQIVLSSQSASAPSVIQKAQPQEVTPNNYKTKATSATSPGAIAIPTKASSVPAGKKKEETFAHGFNTFVDQEGRAKAIEILKQKAKSGSLSGNFGFSK